MWRVIGLRMLILERTLGRGMKCPLPGPLFLEEPNNVPLLPFRWYRRSGGSWEHRVESWAQRGRIVRRCGSGKNRIENRG